MSDDVLRALLTVAFGALAGGLTNTVAIWMLFHPYQPPRAGRLRLGFFQGAIPKNQARLAAAIGRTVGGRLLTEQDLTRIFADVGFRAAFDERLAEFVDTLLHRERGSVRELIPGPMLPEVEALLAEAVERGVRRLEDYLESTAFEEAAGRRATDLVAAVADEPIAGVLTPAREEALAAAVEEWMSGVVESEGFRTALDDYLERASQKLLEPGRTFEEILPLGLVGSLEKAIAGYLPLAIQRLGGLLEDPGARARFETALHDLLHRFLRDLRFHQRVVARLVVTDETVDRVLDTIEAEGAERLSEMLRDPTVQDAMARGVNDAIVDLLRRPVASVLGDAEDPSVAEVRRTLSGWVLAMARDAATRAFLVEKLRAGLEKAGARTWGEVFERVPPEKLAEWLVAAARSDPARRVYREAAARLTQGVLDRPLGVAARWLPEGAPRRIEAALADPVWGWLQTQVPHVVQRLNVAQRVEEKVLQFPMKQMEELVRRVTDRELRLIVRLGYVLGAMIGGILVAVDLVLR